MGEIRPIAANAALRAFQNRWRSASSRATRTSSEPLRSQIAVTSSKRVSHSRSAPSSSTSSAAPRIGKPACAACSAASIAFASIISIAPGTIPPCTISDTASPASRVWSKNATSVRTVSGDGHDPQPHLRGDAERALGADERAEQVVAGRVELVAADLDHLAVGEHDLEAGARSWS